MPFSNSNYSPRIRWRLSMEPEIPLGIVLLRRKYLGYTPHNDCIHLYPYTSSAGYKAYMKCRMKRVEVELNYRNISLAYIPLIDYRKMSDYQGNISEQSVSKTFSYWKRPPPKKKLVKKCITPPRILNRNKSKGEPKWYYPKTRCYSFTTFIKQKAVRINRSYVHTFITRYRPPPAGKGKRAYDMKPVMDIKITNSFIGTDKLRKTNLRNIDLVSPSVDEKAGYMSFLNDNTSAANPLGIQFTPRGPSLLAYRGESPNVLDMYKNIADNLGNIADFTMETEANMLVQLLEIKQLAKIFAVRALALANPLTAIASLFLLTEFAIKPTIGDIETLISMNKKLVKAVDEWNAKAGTVQYFHYQLGKYKHSESVNHSVYLDYYRHEIKCRATIAIIGSRITLPNSAILLSQMGFNKPIAALWEIIPFSFVVDWFTDVNGWISAFETPASPARFRVVDAIWSLKGDIVATRQKAPDVEFEEYKTGVQSVTQYERKSLDLGYLNSSTFVSDASAWTPTSRFGAKQALISVALAVVLHPASARRSKS